MTFKVAHIYLQAYLILHIALFVDGTLLVRKNSNALHQHITEVLRVSCLPNLQVDPLLNTIVIVSVFPLVIVTVFDMADIKTLEHTQ